MGCGTCYPNLTGNAVDVPLKDLGTSEQITVQAADKAGNYSRTYQVKNPNYNALATSQPNQDQKPTVTPPAATTPVKPPATNTTTPSKTEPSTTTPPSGSASVTTGTEHHSLTKESLGIPVLAIGVPTVVGAAAIVHDTVNTMIETLATSMTTKGMGDFIQEMPPDEQYDLIRELLEPEFGSLYVTPPNIDEMIGYLSFTISEGIHQAVFEENEN